MEIKIKPAILLGHISDRNSGALIRSAEAFGINLVLNIGDKKDYIHGSEGAYKHMIYHDFKSIDSFIDYCKINNHSIICLENIKSATPLSEVTYPCNPVFITGNESMGVPEEILKHADLIIKIPQAFSYVRCLNTTVACSLIMFDWFQKNNKIRNYDFKK